MVGAPQLSAVKQESDPVSVEDFLHLHPKLKCQVKVNLQTFSAAHLDAQFCALHNINIVNAQMLCDKLDNAQLSGE